MKIQRVGNFPFGRAFWMRFLAIGLWANLVTASFAQGDTAIQGTVSDASGRPSRAQPSGSRIWKREPSGIR